MKVLKYNLCSLVEEKEILTAVEMGWSEANEEIAKKEAHNGQYTIEEVEWEEPVAEDMASRIAELEAALAALLEGATE